LTKERAEKGIDRLQKDYDLHDQKLDYYRNKLQFSTHNEFFEKTIEFSREKEEKTANIYKQSKEIKTQRDTLDKAEKALKQGQIREVASQYPELKNAGQYMRYETAMKLKELNEKAGKTVPVDEMKKILADRKETTRTYTKAINDYDRAVKNAKTAEAYFEQLHQVEKKIEKVENNPFLKGKLLFSKEAKKEHQQNLENRDGYKTAIEKMGYKDREHLEQHKEKLIQGQPLREKFTQTIQNLETGNHKGGYGAGTSFLQSIIQGIEQAQQREDMERRRQEKQRYRGKKTKELGWER
jgi:hypothetical protein